MAQSRASKRYARALFRLAEERGNTEALRAEVLAAVRLIDASDDLAAFLANPSLDREHQGRILDRLFQGRVEPLFLHFLQLLAQRRRLALLRDACEEFEIIYRDARGLLDVHIRSAFEMEVAQVQRIGDKFRQRYGKEVESHVNIDASLLGGFLVRVGDTVHDYSVKGKLDALRTRLCGGRARSMSADKA